MKHRSPPLMITLFMLAACDTDPAQVTPSASTPSYSNARISDRFQLPIRDLEALRPLSEDHRFDFLKETRLPDLGPANPLFFHGGSAMPGATAPGSASYLGAPVFDWNSSTGPSVIGTGSYSVTVNGVTYSSATAESVAGVLVDSQTGTSYVVLSLWSIEIDPLTMAEIGTVVHAIAPSTDFAPGATVALDGWDRLLFFAHGDLSFPDPQIAAIAETGSIHFLSGGLNLGDLISADVSGDFSEIQLQPSNPPPPPTGGTIPAGNYTMTVVPQAYVYCDGTLAGQESAFAGITAQQLGLTGGAVSLTVTSATQLDVSGAAIASAYGSQSLLLESTPDMPPGIFAGFATPAGSGPLNTTVYGAYLALDSSSASATLIAGGAGVGYITADQSGFCSVDFEVNLTP
jgi:hypothetical protein